MAETKQELAADLVWRYVEFLREKEAAGAFETFTREELEQLAAVMETASGVSRAICNNSPETARAGVRARLEAVVRPVQPPVPDASPVPPSRPLLGFFRSTRMVPAWSLAAALVVSLGLGGLLGTVSMWHRPPVVVKRVKVPVNVDDVEPIDEREVHRLLPHMVRNELTPSQEKNLMWHMLICPGCFDRYVTIKHLAPMAHSDGTRLVRY